MANITLSNGLKLEKYNLVNGFYSGINNLFPGSGYLDTHDENLILISSRGIISYAPTNFSKDFKQIKNNLNEFIGLKQFDKNKWFSFKDVAVVKNKIYVSFTEEINNDCWNTSVLHGDLNYEEIQFKKLFSPKNCVKSKEGGGFINREFNAHQSGGRIIAFDENNILLTLGDYRNRDLAQNDQFPNGKIIKLNIKKPELYQIMSKGHRNPQGLLLDQKNNYLLETEHGPKGGDEINLIKIVNSNSKSLPNFGWPISSAGYHYRPLPSRYKKYPLYKSHSKYGYIEPLKTFVPSIGISEIAQINHNKFVVSSLKDQSLYFFNLNSNNKILNLERVEVFERIRDLKYINNKLFLFLEDTPSIGIIKL